MSRASTEQLPGAPDPWVGSEMPRFRSRPPYVMTEMIAAEPALAQRLVRRLREQDATERLADAIRRAATKNRPVLLTGCGTSEHAAMAVAELLTVLLIIPIIVLIPAVFVPRGRVFEAAMTGAREAGTVTPALRAAWADPAVAMARRYELVATAIIVFLMVVKPF